jgi:hypothetical protein
MVKRMTNYPPNYDRWPSQPPPGNYDPQATYTPPPKKRLRWLPWALAGAFVLVVMLVCAALLAADPKGDPVAPKATPAATKTAQAQPGAKAAKSAAPTKAAALPTRVDDGTFIVGKDVAAGEYKTKGAAEGILTLCTWSTSRDNSFNKVTDFGAVNDVDQPGIVTLKKGQYFKTDGCQPWVRQ